MKKMIILMTLILSACQPYYFSASVGSEFYYLGDEFCYDPADGEYAIPIPKVAGFDYSCKPNARAIGSVIPPGYTSVFYALGARDALDVVAPVPPEEYRAELSSLMLESDAPVYCVLFDAARPELAEYRQAMLAECTYTVDPAEHGHTFNNHQTLRGTGDDLRRFGEALAEFASGL